MGLAIFGFNNLATKNLPPAIIISLLAIAKIELIILFNSIFAYSKEADPWSKIN